jgi:hypothetical protein
MKLITCSKEKTFVSNYRMLIAVLLLVLAIPLGKASAETQYSVIDLGDLGGNVSAAHAINNSGQIVGYSRDDLGNPINAVFWATSSSSTTERTTKP